MSTTRSRATDVATQFSQILSDLRGFPTEELNRVDGLAQAGEWAIALENLCSQLYEHDFAVTTRVRSEIEALGRALSVDPRYWTRLAVR